MYSLETMLFTEKTPLDEIVDNEERKQLYRLVIKLRPSYREIIVLYYYCDFTLKEIVQITGLTTGAAKVLLFRARKKLKAALEGENEI